MRSPFLSTLVLLACSAFAAAAHADTFSLAFTPTGGTTQTFKVDSMAAQGSLDVAPYWNDSTIQGWKAGNADQQVVLYSPQYFSNYGYGSLDLFWEDSTGYAYYTGAQLYSTANSIVTILSGTYQLAGDQALGYCGRSATLVITDLTKQVNTAATPEPSSLILLGTGLMGAAGMARRRFLTA